MVGKYFGPILALCALFAFCVLGEKWGGRFMVCVCVAGCAAVYLGLV
jgi:hypothetical protein